MNNQEKKSVYISTIMLLKTEREDDIENLMFAQREIDNLITEGKALDQESSDLSGNDDSDGAREYEEIRIQQGLITNGNRIHNAKAELENCRRIIHVYDLSLNLLENKVKELPDE